MTPPENSAKIRLMKSGTDPQKIISRAVRQILVAIGDDPDRPELKKTPARVAAMYAEIFGGIRKDPAKEITRCEENGHEEMIMVKDIPLYSMCEHHLLPFFGKAHVAYIPTRGRITGLSKIARAVETISRRLQTQERMTSQIADVLVESLKPRGVLVVIEAEHLCMVMRGIKKPGSITVTSAVRGSFRKNAATRAEAFALIKN
jgi:GTP cyclohydrolase IA